jgi:hypothetical protein
MKHLLAAAAIASVFFVTNAQAQTAPAAAPKQAKENKVKAKKAEKAPAKTIETKKSPAPKPATSEKKADKK